MGGMGRTEEGTGGRWRSGFGGIQLVQPTSEGVVLERSRTRGTELTRWAGSGTSGGLRRTATTRATEHWRNRTEAGRRDRRTSHEEEAGATRNGGVELSRM